MKNRKILIYRIIFLILIIVGIGINFISKNFSLNLLLSYYTIQSNLIVAIILILEIINYFKEIKLFKSEKTFQNIKGAATLIILITGLIFTVLLSPYVKDWKGFRLYSSYILHYITPTMCLIDFILFDKTTEKLKFKKILFWFIYPLIYYLFGVFRILYLDGFVPYPFMNVKELGIIKSILILISLLVIFYLLAILLCWTKNKINKKNHKLN